MNRLVMGTACLLAMLLTPAAERPSGCLSSGQACAQVMAEHAVGAEAVSHPSRPAIAAPAPTAVPAGRAPTPGPTRTVLPSVVLPRGWQPVELRHADAGCMAYCFEKAGRLMVPFWSLRAVGATAGRDDSGWLIISLSHRAVFLWPGVRTFLIRERGRVAHGTWRSLPKRVRGDLFVPLRETARALGFDIVRDGLALRLIPARVGTVCGKT